MGTSTEELNREIEATRTRMTQDVDALQDRVSPSAIVERRKAAAKGRLSSIKDSVMGTAGDAATSVRHAGGSVGGSVGGTASGAGDSIASAAGSTVDSGRDAVQGSPLAAGLVAFGAGLIVSALVPATQKEAEVSQQVVQTAKEKAKPVLQDAATSAQEAGSNLKDEVARVAGEVKDSAAESSQRVRDEAASSVEEVRDQAPGT